MEIEIVRFMYMMDNQEMHLSPDADLAMLVYKRPITRINNDYKFIYNLMTKEPWTMDWVWATHLVWDQPVLISEEVRQLLDLAFKLYINETPSTIPGTIYQYWWEITDFMLDYGGQYKSVHQIYVNHDAQYIRFSMPINSGEDLYIPQQI